MENKKYYFLKLNEWYFCTPAIRLLQSKPGGDTYSILLLRLYLYTLKTGGRLVKENGVKLTVPELATIMGKTVHRIQLFMREISELGLLQVDAKGVQYLPELENMVGRSSTEADRKSRKRDELLGLF